MQRQKAIAGAGNVVSARESRARPVSSRTLLAPSGAHGGVLALQALVGNAAVSRLVEPARTHRRTADSGPRRRPRSGAARSPAAGGRDLALQRFPATAVTTGTNWVSETGAVRHPGEGASGGVYILTAKDANAPIRTVVVKPIFGESGLGTVESGASMTFGDQAVRELLGVEAPISRSVTKGSEEYRQLLGLCDPKAPPRPVNPEEARAWKPLSDARSFVVMSEVPSSTTIGSLAEKSVSDPRAAGELNAAVFDPDFLHQLGRLCIGDLLIGNNDRMVARAMNVGNVMISSQNGKHSLYAIDTNAVLGRDLAPEEVLRTGSASRSLHGGFSSTKTTLADGPGEILDGFYRVIAGRMKGAQANGGHGPTELALDPVTLFTDSYEAQRPRLLQAFTAGWQSGLDTVRDLVESREGRAKMRQVVAGVGAQQGSGQVTYHALKTNAMYLAGRAKGKDHAQSASGAAAFAAAKMLAEFDLASATIPDDGHSWNVARVPSREVLGADLRDLPRAPDPRHVLRVAPPRERGVFDGGYFTSVLQGAGNIKADADALGPKQRGLFTRTAQTRNRTTAGRFVAETYLLGAAAQRAAAASDRLGQLGATLEVSIGAALTPSQARSAIPAADHLRAVLPRFRRDVGEFGDGLSNASKGVASLSRLSLAPSLAQVLAQVAKRMRDQEEVLAGPRLANPNIYVNALRGAGAQ